MTLPPIIEPLILPPIIDPTPIPVIWDPTWLPVILIILAVVCALLSWLSWPGADSTAPVSNENLNEPPLKKKEQRDDVQEDQEKEAA